MIESDTFSERIVTCDVVWVYHYDPETEKQSIEWNHTNFPVCKKIKIQYCAGKVRLTMFWDSHGLVYCDFLEDQLTMNNNITEMLEHQAGPARENVMGSYSPVNS